MGEARRREKAGLVCGSVKKVPAGENDLMVRREAVQIDIKTSAVEDPIQKCNNCLEFLTGECGAFEEKSIKEIGICIMAGFHYFVCD